LTWLAYSGSGGGSGRRICQNCTKSKAGLVNLIKGTIFENRNSIVIIGGKMKSTIETIAHVATALSAITALCVYAFNVSVYHDTENQKNLLKWQRERVYSIIVHNKFATFQQIKASYLNEAQQENNVILKRIDIQDNTLNDILMYLSMQRIVCMTNDQKYFVPTMNVVASTTEKTLKNYMDMVHNSHMLAGQIITFLITDSGKYTIDELLGKIKERYKDIKDMDYYPCITDLLISQEIYIDGNGRVCSALK
jgi:hypothetical protein